LIYLDNGATSFPKPQAVVDAVADTLRGQEGSAHRRGYAASDPGSEVVESARRQLGQLIGADERDKVIFTLNSTDALNSAIRVLARPGSHVLTGPMEHAAVGRTLTALQDQGQISFDRAALNEAGLVGTEAMALVTPQTRLAVFCHASNVTGDVIVDPAVCHALRSAGVTVILDLSQAVGAIPIDVKALGADLVAFSGHKSLMGPSGVGCLWVAADFDLPAFRFGGIGIKGEDDVLKLQRSSDFETGTQNIVGLAGLDAALKYILSHDLKTYFERKQDLTRGFAEVLARQCGVRLFGRYDDTWRLPLMSFIVDGLDPVSELAPILHHGFGIITRAGLHCAPWAHKVIGTFASGTVRVSFGSYNDKADLDAFSEALKDIIRKGV
jgi:selenocysteine lyase/cysteine desulfurase